MAEPDAGSNLYGAQIDVSSTQTIKARSIDAAGNPGAVGTFTYTIGQPPPAPTSVTSTEQLNAVRVSWAAVTGANGYNVYRAGSNTLLNASPITTTSYTDTVQANGTAYSYFVRSVRSGAESADSAPTSTVVGAPLPPAVLTATPGDARVALSWSTSSGAASYRVYRNGVLLNSRGVTNYADTSVVNGQLYTYTVTALDNVGHESAVSDAQQATPTAPANAAPTVTGRTPATNATAVPVANNINATFSEAVSGVSGTTFTLRNAAGAAVAAVVSRNATTNQYILNPNANLAPDTRYTATLTGGASAIRDSAGAALATTSWSFVTGPAPRVSARTPGVGATAVSRTANVTATFSEAVTGVSGTTFRLTNPAGNTVSAGVTRDGTTNRWVLNPSITLAPNATFRVTLTGGATAIRDNGGNPLANTTWTFTTGG